LELAEKLCAKSRLQRFRAQRVLHEATGQIFGRGVSRRGLVAAHDPLRRDRQHTHSQARCRAQHLQPRLRGDSARRQRSGPTEGLGSRGDRGGRADISRPALKAASISTGAMRRRDALSSASPWRVRVSHAPSRRGHSGATRRQPQRRRDFERRSGCSRTCWRRTSTRTRKTEAPPRSGRGRRRTEASRRPPPERRHGHKSHSKGFEGSQGGDRGGDR
jgi:hypothetical protein